MAFPHPLSPPNRSRTFILPTVALLFLLSSPLLTIASTNLSVDICTNGCSFSNGQSSCTATANTTLNTTACYTGNVSIGGVEGVAFKFAQSTTNQRWFLAVFNATDCAKPHAVGAAGNCQQGACCDSAWMLNGNLYWGWLVGPGQPTPVSSPSAQSPSNGNTTLWHWALGGGLVLVVIVAVILLVVFCVKRGKPDYQKI